MLKKPVTMASLRHMLHKWMPRRNASSFKLQSDPTPLGRGIKSGSGIFSARILLVEDCEVCRGRRQLLLPLPLLPATALAACRCCCLPPRLPRLPLPAACACAYLRLQPAAARPAA